MFIRKHAFRLICLCITILMLIGCVPSPDVAPTPMLSPLPSPEASAIPISATDATLVVSPLPLPVGAATKMPHTSGMGAVSGDLERFDGTPLRGILVYVAFIEERNGMRLASVDPLLDAHSVTDAQGYFSLDNLAPGEYALATQSPVGIIMPHNAAGEIVKLTIEADGEIALGRLAVGYIYPDND